MNRCALLLATVLAAASSFAKSDYIFDYATNRVTCSGWVNLDETHHISGDKWTPVTISNRTVVIHRWCLQCPGISKSIAEFIEFSKKYPEVVCIASYYPDKPHTRADVEKCVRSNNLKLPVYTGAAHVNAKFCNRHRAIYVVTPGGAVIWEEAGNSKKLLNQLETEFATQYESLLIEEIRLTKNAARKRRLKDVFKKLYPNSVTKIKKI